MWFLGFLSDWVPQAEGPRAAWEPSAEEGGGRAPPSKSRGMLRVVILCEAERKTQSENPPPDPRPRSTDPNAPVTPPPGSLRPGGPSDHAALKARAVPQTRT